MTTPLTWARRVALEIGHAPALPAAVCRTAHQAADRSRRASTDPQSQLKDTSMNSLGEQITAALAARVKHRSSQPDSQSRALKPECTTNDRQQLDWHRIAYLADTASTSAARRSALAPAKDSRAQRHKQADSAGHADTCIDIIHKEDCQSDGSVGLAGYMPESGLGADAAPHRPSATRSHCSSEQEAHRGASQPGFVVGPSAASGNRSQDAVSDGLSPAAQSTVVDIDGNQFCAPAHMGSASVHAAVTNSTTTAHHKPHAGKHDLMQPPNSMCSDFQVLNCATHEPGIRSHAPPNTGASKQTMLQDLFGKQSSNCSSAPIAIPLFKVKAAADAQSALPECRGRQNAEQCHTAMVFMPSSLLCQHLSSAVRERQPNDAVFGPAAFML